MTLGMARLVWNSALQLWILSNVFCCQPGNKWLGLPPRCNLKTYDAKQRDTMVARMRISLNMIIKCVAAYR